MLNVRTASFVAGITLAVCAATASMADELNVKVLASYGTDTYTKGASEIVVHDAKGQRLYVVNGAANAIDILDFKNPSALTKIKSVPLSAYGKMVNSAAVHGDTLVVAVESDPKQDPGKLVIFDRDGNNARTVTVGALPDMVAITSDGEYALVANEGEPSKDYKNDPEGTVSIVRLSDLSVRTVTFGHLKRSDFGAGAHFPSPAGTTMAQDVEPEYIALSADNKTAYVSLQENNALAVIDIASAKVTKVFALGYKDYSKHAVDLSDKDGGINLKTWPVKSLYQPDTIATFQHEGQTYIVTANEGDARDYPGYSEEARGKDLVLDEKAFPNAKELQDPKALGRLKVTKAHGDNNGDGKHEEIIGYGGRSFSIWKPDGSMVYDSGNEFSTILSKLHPTWFNSEGQTKGFDGRSDDKGIEPEGLTIGTVNGKRYAFIGLERMSGILAYDISNPTAPKYVSFFHNGKPDGDSKKKTAGDVAPEGMAFVDASKSPTGNALLVTANEVSGTTTVFELK